MKELLELWKKYSEEIDKNNKELGEMCEGFEEPAIDVQVNKSFDGFMDWILENYKPN